MDVKGYFRKIREMEAQIGAGDVIVRSYTTSDGGRDGVFSEVSPRVASQLVVEGRARLATAEETEQYRQMQADALKAAEEAALADRIQIKLLTTENQGLRLEKGKR